MATFAYVAALDTTQAEFSIETFDGKYYLQFGRLNADDRRLFESIISGGYIGFFQNNSEYARAEIVDRFSGNGLQIAEIPVALTLGESYEIRWTQARPGEPAPPTEAVVDQGIVRFSTAVDGEMGVPMQFSLDYRVVDKEYIAFQPRFYASPADFDTDRPIPEDDPRYPEDIRISPRLPFILPGFYVHDIQLTPRYSGTLLISVDLLEDVELPESDVELYQFVDVNGNRLVDVNGNVFVGFGDPMFQFADINGNRLVDVNGNVLVGFR